MRLRNERSEGSARKQRDTLSYLSRRVRQEATAAVEAASVQATTIHVILATAYAKRINERSDH